VPNLGLARVNDACRALFVHSVYSLAVGIRKSLLSSIWNRSREDPGSALNTRNPARGLLFLES
jgi:hypothetical protein